MKQTATAIAILLAAVTTGCRPQAERIPANPLLVHDAPIVTDGVPRHRKGLDLRITSEDKNGISRGSLKYGRTVVMGGSSLMDGVYAADAVRLIAIAPDGFQVLFVDQSGPRSNPMVRFRLVLFKYGKKTELTIFGGLKVTGEFRGSAGLELEQP